jgi:hypothetical protein
MSPKNPPGPRAKPANIAKAATTTATTTAKTGSGALPAPGASGPRPRATGRGIVFIHPAERPSFVAFPPARMVLGRDPAAGIPLDGRAVSWQHAEIFSVERDFFIRDLESTNGVVIAGHRVGEARLDDQTLLRIGDFLGVVTEGPVADDSDELFPEATRLGLVIGPALGAALAPLAQLSQGGQGTANDPTTTATRIAIEGETGTGKSLIARLVQARVRPKGTFAVIDCASWNIADEGPAGLPRLYEAALPRDGRTPPGTLYLTNLTALSPPAQARLLAALRDKTAETLSLVVGSQEPLEQAERSGRLDPGLRALLAPLTVRIPPLRKRTMEIPRLFRRLLAQSARRAPSLSTELIERLCLYDWPCNVREMSLVAQRLMALHGDEPRLRVAHLPARLQPPDRDDTTLPVAPVVGVDLRELLNAVRDSGGNIGGAASRLGITRERAYRLIDRLGLVRGSA